MKIASDKNPVKSTWLTDQGLRLDAGAYLSGALEARKLIEGLPRATPLAELTTGHNGGIFNGPKFSRTYLNSPEHAVRFLGSTDMLEADFSFLPLLAKSIANKFPYLEIEPGMTLISCSGTVGRVAYVRPDMQGIWSSQHVMKIQANENKIPSGYLYTFLRSSYGVPIIASAAYGAIIQHIEPQHIADLPVPRFASEVEQKIHQLVEEAAGLRASYQISVRAATTDFFKSVGLAELDTYQWHKEERDLGFEMSGVTSTTLRSLNFAPRAQHLLDRLSSVGRSTSDGVGLATLGTICSNGTLRTGARFKRIDSDSKHGVRLVGQRQAFWVRPMGRWISAEHAPDDVLQDDETVLIAAHGTLGENEVYGRSILVTGSWLSNAFSQDFVRVLSGDREIPGAYLFAFLRSDVAFRILRSMSVGGKQQEYHTTLLRALPIPLAPVADRERIAETVRKAYRDRDRANVLEDEALSLLAKAIEEASV